MATPLSYPLPPAYSTQRVLYLALVLSDQEAIFDFCVSPI